MSIKRNRYETAMRVSTAVALIFAAGLAGCADYLSPNDTITVSAGNAQNHNKAVHIIDPWPAHAKKTKIPADGERMARVIEGYKGGVIPPITGPGTYEPPIDGFAGGAVVEGEAGPEQEDSPE